MYRLLQAIFAIFVLNLSANFFANGEICTSEVCEYYFDIEHHRTMTYNKGIFNTFNAMLNGSKVILEPDAHLRPLPTTGDITDDVITGDGVRRNIITVNKMFPGPAIEVMEGAQVVVHVSNHLMTQAVTIHWHGMHQELTPWMDGVAYVAQCPILPRQSFTYRFIATPAGTHWYHDHIVGQRSDGLMGLLIVHKRSPPVLPEAGLMIMDWFHFDSTTAELTNFYSPLGGAGDYMHPFQTRDYSHDGVELSAFKYESGLINGRGRFGGNMAPLTTTTVSQGNTILFRMVNSGAEFYYEVSVDLHKLNIVALDGNDIEPKEVDAFIIAPGERIDFQLTANQIAGNYWVRCRSLKSGMSPEVVPDGEEQVILAILHYEGTPSGDPTSLSRSCTPDDPCLTFNCPFGGYPTLMNKRCVHIDEVQSALNQEDLDTIYGLRDQVHEEHILNFGFAYGAGINSVSFAEPRIPFFDPNYKKGIELCDTEQCRRTDIGCRCTQTIEIPFNKTIQFVFSNYYPVNEGEVPVIGHHSIHMHGHSFAVLKMGFPSYNTTNGRALLENPDVYCDNLFCRKPRWSDRVPDLNTNKPVIRDTVNVPARGYTVIRFRSTNPGHWLLHCHMENHAIGGMSLVITEAPERIPPAPKDYPSCTPFEWSQSEFSEYLNNSNNSHPTTSTQSAPSTPAPTKPAPRGRDDMYVSGNSVVLPTNIFITLIFGSVTFGFCLMFIPFIFMLCRRSKTVA